MDWVYREARRRIGRFPSWLWSKNFPSSLLFLLLSFSQILAWVRRSSLVSWMSPPWTSLIPVPVQASPPLISWRQVVPPASSPSSSSLTSSSSSSPSLRLPNFPLPSLLLVLLCVSLLLHLGPSASIFLLRLQSCCLRCCPLLRPVLHNHLLVAFLLLVALGQPPAPLAPPPSLGLLLLGGAPGRWLGQVDGQVDSGSSQHSQTLLPLKPLVTSLSGLMTAIDTFPQPS